MKLRCGRARARARNHLQVPLQATSIWCVQPSGASESPASLRFEHNIQRNRNMRVLGNWLRARAQPLPQDVASPMQASSNVERLQTQ